MSAHEPIPVLVLGTGKIGRLVCQLLATSGDYAVTAVDLQAGQAEAAVRAATTATKRAVTIEIGRASCRERV